MQKWGSCWGGQDVVFIGGKGQGYDLGQQSHTGMAVTT